MVLSPYAVVGLLAMMTMTTTRGEWVDEDDEGEEEDLLELEYHPTYVNNVEKRRRRWENLWEALIQAVVGFPSSFGGDYC